MDEKDTSGKQRAPERFDGQRAGEEEEGKGQSCQQDRHAGDRAGSPLTASQTHCSRSDGASSDLSLAMGANVSRSAQTWRIQFRGLALSYQTTGCAKDMLTILLIIVVLLLFGGGGGYYGRRAGWGRRGFGGLLLTALILVLLIWVVNELIMPPLPMPEGVPSIIR